MTKAKITDAFSPAGESDRLLALAKAGAPIPGQTISAAARAKAQGNILALAEDHDVLEAAAFTEEIIKYLNDQWNERGFSAEQRVFSVALATINLRQHLPTELGGKEAFDATSRTAWEYFNKNRVE